MRTRPLCHLGNIKDRTLRKWIEAGLVERPKDHGVNTFYSPRAVLQVRVIARMRAAGMRFDVIVPKVRGASDAALKALLPPPPKPAEAPVTAVARAEGVTGERWVHVTLMPGLQLMVHADASEFVLRTAAEIAQRYKAHAGDA